MRHKETPISTVINDLSVSEERWFAVHTKYKCEKYVVEQLAKKGIAAYVPLVTKVKQYATRKKSYLIPLINSHIFVKINKRDYTKVLQSEYVFSFVKQRRNLIHIPNHEIDILKLIVGESEYVEVTDLSMCEGDAVEIVGGNLTGVKGVLVQESGNNKFVVELNSIGVQLVMTINRSNLRLLKKSA